MIDFTMSTTDSKNKKLYLLIAGKCNHRILTQSLFLKDPQIYVQEQQWHNELVEKCIPKVLALSRTTWR